MATGVINRDDRRLRALSATLRVIAAIGLEQTTVREIAKEAGCSTGSLAYYFTDKEDLLRQALELADSQIAARLKKIIAGTPPRLALRQVLCEVLPLDEQRSVELALDVHFWGRALIQPNLRVIEHADHDRWRAVVYKLVSEIQQPDEGEDAVDDTTDVIVAFVDGVGLQALIYPELLPPERQLRLLDRLLHDLGVHEKTTIPRQKVKSR